LATVDIRKVEKSYGTSQVLHGIDLEIRHGEFAVILGPSGCGKSTLLRMIAGLEEISGGEIAIDGRVVNRLEPRERDIAMVFQNYALYPHMSVAENMSYSLRIAHAPKATIRDKVAGFTGQISDLDGPTANMYRMACKDAAIEAACRRLSCVYPDICDNLGTDHTPLIHLYRKARQLPGVKKVLIGSGLRYDLAVRSPEYVQELVAHHVGGYLKIAPEHTEAGPLSKMMKPGMGSYDKFKRMFEAASKAAGKEQYLIPYFIAAHPGTTDTDMLELALWLKRNGFRLDQVQTFLPTPLAIATAMWHTGKNPLKRLSANAEDVAVVRGGRQRKLQKAFLRYHDPKNWPLLREALKTMGRADLIGNGKKHLVPAWQPEGINQPERDSRRRAPAIRRARKPQSV